MMTPDRLATHQRRRLWLEIDIGNVARLGRRFADGAVDHRPHLLHDCEATSDCLPAAGITKFIKERSLSRKRELRVAERVALPPPNSGEGAKGGSRVQILLSPRVF